MFFYTKMHKHVKINKNNDNNKLALCFEEPENDNELFFDGFPLQ
jgi:hypothetical protein